jgi:poly-gamma-glutamate capsule biosynthesis protein CapA/YwtB (metallophosphatase superfamily)
VSQEPRRPFDRGTGRGSRPRRALVAVAVVVLAVPIVAACGHPADRADAAPGATFTLAFVGDLMLGRGVAPVVAGDPSSIFEQLRPALAGADLVLGNLESPLTRRPHEVGEHALEADPDAARLLAGAGFDVLSLANNHATDAGSDGVTDTLAALSTSGLRGVGAGATADDAGTPLLLDVAGARVGIVAFDMAGGRPATATTAGVNPWDLARARDAVTRLRRDADVVVVSLHGGVEHLPRPDPVLEHATELLAEWGADVVWGHGAHVDFVVDVAEGPEARVVVAPGLGNALFDQRLPGADEGAVLQVMADRDGVLAMRTGRIEIDAGRSALVGWDDPAGDAVALDGSWWTPVRPWAVAPAAETSSSGRPLPAGAVEVARAAGDVTGTGAVDVVVAYLRAATPHRVRTTFPGAGWLDADGRTAHLAVFTSEPRMRWGSSLMLQPVGAIAVCTGSMALTFTSLAEPGVVGGGAWFWDSFGFRTAPVLDGAATAACADLDGDGRTEPLLTGRNRSGTLSDPTGMPAG